MSVTEQELLQQHLCDPCQYRRCTVPLESINQYAVTNGYLALQRLCLSRAHTLVLIRVIWTPTASLLCYMQHFLAGAMSGTTTVL